MRKVLFNTAGEIQVEVFELKNKTRLIKFKKGDEEFSFKAKCFTAFGKQDKEIGTAINIPPDLPKKHLGIIEEFFALLAEKERIMLAKAKIKALVDKAAEQEKLIKVSLRRNLECSFNKIVNVLQTYIKIKALLTDLLNKQKQVQHANKNKEHHLDEGIRYLEQSLNIIIKKSYSYYNKLKKIQEERNDIVFKHFTKGKTVH